MTDQHEPTTSQPRAPSEREIEAAHAIYTPRNLKLYDFVVHGFSNRFAWRCPTRALDAHYETNLSSNHLEAAVGTGFFLERAKRPGFDRLTLLDINGSCLEEAERRLAGYGPDLLQASLFDPVPVSQPYDSVGLTYVLHCLPGAMTEKLAVIDNLKPAMHGETVLFGATILGQAIKPNLAAKALLSTYNRKGVFHNREDDFASLAQGLRDRFDQVRVWQEGCVALFRAQGLGAGE
ncbi:class I SAM-dependent methyltransferase [Methyloligella solikamskensis]|uniref:Class I SAM-dependent methyltransferase n=1 Tax=Methyloligella solikamskensis TaxID=1177756 RepID=A0ABW3J8U3_9HYPH